MEMKCKICGKEVQWGFDGCPTIKARENETSAQVAMRALTGDYNYVTHYDCKNQ